jgi:threonylcarbamoyladenosine tRNA methylthiotransferase MtaB
VRVYLEKVGCKLNQSEIETLGRGFVQAGHRLVQASEEANLCVVNTCTVTQAADSKSRKVIRRLRRANPTARLVVTGCYAEMCPEEVEAIDGVDLIVGNEDKERLVELVGKLGNWETGGLVDWETGRSGHTRAFVKIQDGCNNRCAYCIVSLARGRERSRSRHEILAEIEGLVAAGCKEVVLTGVHIGGYGRDLGTGLGHLVEDILTETTVPRLRLSSIEPWDLEPSLLRLWENSRLCRHLHLPLQSGCDATLQRMGRRYTASQYARLVAAARRLIPNLAVTTDVIAGFPGETAEEFAVSLSFVEAMEFARAHVFKYSARPGTAAAEMPHQVPFAEKKRRSEAMLELARKSSQRFHCSFLGRRMEVLWEMRCGDDKHAWSGLTDNYIRVMTNSELNLANTITSTKLVGVVKGGMRGEVGTQPPPPEPFPALPQSSPTLGGRQRGEEFGRPSPGFPLHGGPEARLCRPPPWAMSIA